MIGQTIKNKRDELAYKKEISQLVDKKAVLIAYSNQTGVINSKINSLEKDLETKTKRLIVKSKSQATCTIRLHGDRPVRPL